MWEGKSYWEQRTSWEQWGEMKNVERRFWEASNSTLWMHSGSEQGSWLVCSVVSMMRSLNLWFVSNHSSNSVQIKKIFSAYALPRYHTKMFLLRLSCNQKKTGVWHNKMEILFYGSISHAVGYQTSWLSFLLAFAILVQAR